MNNHSTNTTIGIDVSKARLDVCVLPQRQRHQFNNDLDGIAALVRMAKTAKPSLLIFEPSGGYERAVQQSLITHGLPCAKVNARRIRQFARCTGRIAKTDNIDADVLAHYGAVINPEAISEVAPDAGLSGLIKRRQQLVGELVRERNRLEKQPCENAAASILRHVAFIEEEISCFDKQIKSYIASSADLAAKAKVLGSFKGVGQQTIAILLAEMPELGRIGVGQIVSLAGLAPHNNDSGTMKGKRTISGGRAAVRKVLYMAALTAIRQDGFVRDFYQRLIQQGKPGKVALTAAMRKLLVRLNARMRDEFYA